MSEAKFEAGDRVYLRPDSDLFGTPCNPADENLLGTIGYVNSLDVDFPYGVRWDNDRPNCYRDRDLEHADPKLPVTYLSI